MLWKSKFLIITSSIGDHPHTVSSRSSPAVDGGEAREKDGGRNRLPLLHNMLLDVRVYAGRLALANVLGQGDMHGYGSPRSRHGKRKVHRWLETMRRLFRRLWHKSCKQAQCRPLPWYSRLSHPTIPSTGTTTTTGTWSPSDQQALRPRACDGAALLNQAASGGRVAVAQTPLPAHAARGRAGRRRR